MTNRLLDEALPLIYDIDVTVVGGSFAGISCAVELAKSGKKVLIIEPRTYLGRELTASLRPWLILPTDGEPSSLPELIQYCLIKNGMQLESLQPGDYVSLHPDLLKRSLEDCLTANGIELLYASLPISLCENNGQITGLVIANKSGRQAVRCDNLVDATETALIASLSGEDVSVYTSGALAAYYRTLEFTDAAEITETSLIVPEHLKLSGNMIHLHQGCQGEDHIYVDFGMELESGNSLETNRDREIEARHRSMQLAVYLINHIPMFGKAVLSASSHELLGPFPKDTTLPFKLDSISLNSELMSTGFSGVWCLYKSLYQQGNHGLLDAIEASKAGELLAVDLLRAGSTGNTLMSRETSSHSFSVNAYTSSNESMPGSNIDSDMYFSIPSLLAKDTNFPMQQVKGSVIPTLKYVDVLVIGGGSSGASASITSAREGMSTLVLDINPGLGGTGTFGGVDSYWFGRRVGYAEKINNAVLSVQQELHYKGHKWSIEGKMYALLKEAQGAGVDQVLNAITFGAVKRDRQVCGVVIATRWGPFTVMSKTVIDATGDGDVAVYAGSDYVYGSQKDNTVMWYSLAQFQTPSKIKNNFTSMVDVSNVLDYTRAIMAGRRRGTAVHDHGIYIATRESRHIVGDTVMQLSDQLLQRRYPDVINIHFSNHDVKGVSGADWVNVGLIPPNLEIEIPYGMLLPKGLEGILVTGKAVSATHDALPAIRMQSDLENLGAVTALAAAAAVRSQRMPRYIDLKRLQSRLVQERLLPETVQSRKLAPIEYSDKELQQLAASIESEFPLYEYSNMRMNEIHKQPIPFAEISSMGPRIIPFLELELASAEGMKKLRLAQALAMLQSQSGVPVLIEHLTQQLGGTELPIRTADIMYVQLPPDHGAMPEPAYYLYSLAQTKDKRSIPIWQKAADFLQPEEDDFKDTLKGIYYYIDAICQGAERLGEREAIPVLEQLHRIPYLYNQQCLEGFQADYFLERRAMLELAIGRALARCGSQLGYEILIAYLPDVRSLLSKHVLLELQRISGKTYPKDISVWNEWLNEEKPYQRTYPLDLRLDIESNVELIMR